MRLRLGRQRTTCIKISNPWPGNRRFLSLSLVTFHSQVCTAGLPESELLLELDESEELLSELLESELLLLAAASSSACFCCWSSFVRSFRCARSSSLHRKIFFQFISTKLFPIQFFNDTSKSHDDLNFNTRP